jgi:geranylgeranyl diphosphate synthase type I
MVGDAVDRAMSGTSEEFESFVGGVRLQIDRRLGSWLDTKIVDARRRGADVEAVADAVRQLALRGGKRMRAVLLGAAYEACGGEGGSTALLPAFFALELLQAYLLVHDDWMDGDDVRRGGPSVPALMRGRFHGKIADSASVLAGDLAAAWAHQALFELDLPPARVVLAARELARVEEEVVHGQLLDVGGGASGLADVEAMHALKTASYSTRSPVLMGAHLAGAGGAQIAGLAAFATPLGIAFQLRDDVLGTFGDARRMGKPAGSDLKAGKRTALVVEALKDPRARTHLEAVLGRGDARDGAIREAIDAIASCGALARVETRIDALVHECRAALDGVSLAAPGRLLLGQAVVALTERQA